MGITTIAVAVVFRNFLRQCAGKNESRNAVGLRGLLPFTRSGGNSLLDVHLIPAFGKSQLRDLTRDDLQGFLTRKLNSELSWETVHHFKCGLSKILGAAEEWGCVAENVALKTKLPRRQYGTERIVLTPVQVQMLADALREPVRSFTLLLVLTG